MQVDFGILGLAQESQMCWAIRIWTSVKSVCSVQCSWSPLPLYSTCRSVLPGIIFAQNNHSKMQAYTHDSHRLIIFRNNSFPKFNKMCRYCPTPKGEIGIHYYAELHRLLKGKRSGTQCKVLKNNRTI